MDRQHQRRHELRALSVPERAERPPYRTPAACPGIGTGGVLDCQKGILFDKGGGLPDCSARAVRFRRTARTFAGREVFSSPHMSPKKMIGLLCACGRKLCEAFLISRDRRRFRFCSFSLFPFFKEGRAVWRQFPHRRHWLFCSEKYVILCADSQFFVVLPVKI